MKGRLQSDGWRWPNDNALGKLHPDDIGGRVQLEVLSGCHAMLHIEEKLQPCRPNHHSCLTSNVRQLTLARTLTSLATSRKLNMPVGPAGSSAAVTCGCVLAESAEVASSNHHSALPGQLLHHKGFGLQ